MNRFPNQFKVTINKQKVNQKDANRRYFLAYQDVIEAAALNLNGNEFKLFIYFLSNKSDYVDFFSPIDVKRTYGMSEDTARKCFHNLIDKGYLVESAPHDVDFYEEPHIKKYNFVEEKRKDKYGNILTFNQFYEEVKGYAPSEDAIKKMWNDFEVVED